MGAGQLLKVKLKVCYNNLGGSMKKKFLLLLLLLFVFNMEAKESPCPAMYTYTCKGVSAPTAEEERQGVSRAGEWLKCEPVDDNYPIPEATVTTSNDNNNPPTTNTTETTVTTSSDTTGVLNCSYNQSTNSTACSRPGGNNTLLWVVGAGTGIVNVDAKAALLDTKKIIYNYNFTPQITIGMRVPSEESSSFDVGACYNIGANNRGSSFGLYIMSDNAISLSAMFGPNQNKKLSFNSAELAIKIPFQAQRVYFAPKVYVDYFKSYCVDVASNAYKNDGFVVGIGLDINVAVLGKSARKKHIAGSCKQGWERQIAKGKK